MMLLGGQAPINFPDFISRSMESVDKLSQSTYGLPTTAHFRHISGMSHGGHPYYVSFTASMRMENLRPAEISRSSAGVLQDCHLLVGAQHNLGKGWRHVLPF